MSLRRHHSIAFVVAVAFVGMLSLAPLAPLASGAERDSGSSWVSSSSDVSSYSRNSNGVKMTSFAKQGGGAGRKASSDGAEGGDGVDASTAKTIAQRIDEALEQEFPEDKKESVGKTYTEKAKQEDVRS